MNGRSSLAGAWFARSVAFGVLLGVAYGLTAAFVVCSVLGLVGAIHWVGLIGLGFGCFFGLLYGAVLGLGHAVAAYLSTGRRRSDRAFHICIGAAPAAILPWFDTATWVVFGLVPACIGAVASDVIRSHIRIRV